MSEVRDPRPDLAEDTLLWKRLLKMAWLDHGDHRGTNPYAALHCMRCCGATLDLEDAIPPKPPRYVIKPLLGRMKVDPGIDGEEDDLGEPHGVGADTQWVFEFHYKQDREAMLLPHREEVMHYLKRLWEEEVAEGDL